MWEVFCRCGRSPAKEVRRRFGLSGNRSDCPANSKVCAVTNDPSVERSRTYHDVVELFVTI
jgi:hypothetical protein